MNMVQILLLIAQRINMKRFLTSQDVINLAETVDKTMPSGVCNLYPIPNGGIPAALAVYAAGLGKYKIVDKPEDADVFIDDIIDTGATMEQWCDKYPGVPFFALIDKVSHPQQYGNEWIVFPWEGDAETGIENNIIRLLQYVGEDATRGGLLETPKRVAKAWSHWTKGYDVNIPELLKVFEDGADNYNQMVVVKDIPIYSHCEHHLAPIFGTATIAYIPNGKIVGLSKLSRLADAFARRLQVQERLTSQIADALNEHLQPLGVAVYLNCRHMCMESRGICQQGHSTITTALRGVIYEDESARAEFLQYCKE